MSVHPVRTPESERMWSAPEVDLLAKVAAGHNASLALGGMTAAVESIQASLYQEFLAVRSSGNPDVDRYQTLVIQLKGRLLAEIRQRLEATALEGKSAAEELERQGEKKR